MAPRYLPAISSMSLGRAWNHDLPNKLATAASHGMLGMEIFYEDLEYHARHLNSKIPSDASIPPSDLIEAASDIRRLCSQYSLHIICLQPFMQYGGLLDRNLHAKRIDEMKLWIDLAHCLGTDLIAIPSSFLPSSECTFNHDLIVNDMREVSSLGLTANPPIRFAYESLCWGTWTNVWEESWEIVRRVDRPNFGLCLDTFNFAGRIWADPASPTGKTLNADAELEASLQRLRTVPASKVFYVQLVDAERLSSPLVEGHEWYQADQPARMSWSRNARCFPFEEQRGAYLPVMKILEVITDKRNGVGYDGHISFELFSRTMNEKGEHVVEEHARRAAESWGKVVEYMGWEGDKVEVDSVPLSLEQQTERADIIKTDSGIFVSVEEYGPANSPMLEQKPATISLSHSR